MVERRPRAAGAVGDRVDAALVVAVFAEHLESGVENPLLRPLPSRTDLGIGGEGRATDDVCRTAVSVRVDGGCCRVASGVPLRPYCVRPIAVVPILLFSS